MKKTRYQQLLEFHQTMDQPIVSKPTIPSHERVRLRLSLVLEEACEPLLACTDEWTVVHPWRNDEDGGGDIGFSARGISSFLQAFIKHMKVRVRLPEVADALADIDYVVEGSRLEFGIFGEPIADEVHRANMEKANGPVAPNGKRLKPPGWTPPRIELMLREQGWMPDPNPPEDGPAALAGVYALDTNIEKLTNRIDALIQEAENQVHLNDSFARNAKNPSFNEGVATTWRMIIEKLREARRA